MVTRVCAQPSTNSGRTMLLLWPGNWELEEAVKKRCEITSFLETRPDLEARPQLWARAAAGCSGWGRGGRRSGAPTSNRHVGTPLESLWSPGNYVFLRNGKFFWHFLGSGLGCGDRDNVA